MFFSSYTFLLGKQPGLLGKGGGREGDSHSDSIPGDKIPPPAPLGNHNIPWAEDGSNPASL